MSGPGGKCGEDLIGRAHATEPREYLLECETMLFTILTGAGVFNDDKAKADSRYPLSRRGLYPRIGRDSGEVSRPYRHHATLLLLKTGGSSAKASQ